MFLFLLFFARGLIQGACSFSSAIYSSSSSSSPPSSPSSSSFSPSSPFSTSCIIVHGFHRSAHTWQQVVWGVPPHQLGRVPKAVLVAMQQGAAAIAFGSGVVSEVDGIAESKATYSVLANRVHLLHEFTALRAYAMPEIERQLKKTTIIFDVRSRNTLEETRFILNEFVSPRSFIECNRVFLISSPTHVSRCLRDAFVALRDEQEKATSVVDKERLRTLQQNLFATPSDVSYANYDAGDVAIVEPPHKYFFCVFFSVFQMFFSFLFRRPKDFGNRLHSLVARMLVISNQTPKSALQFSHRLETILERYVENDEE